MVNLPPPGSDPNDQQPPARRRDNDEAFAVAIAFLSIGTGLWWGGSRGSQSFLSSSPLPTVSAPALVEEDPLTGGGEDADRPLIPSDRDSARFDAATETDAERLEADRREDRSLFTQAPQQDNRARVNTDLAAPSDAVTAPPPNLSTSEAAIDSESSATDGEPSETATPPPLDISDVAPDYWAYPYIVSLYERGLLPDLPEGRLNPDQEMTRAEFAALLNSSFVKDEPAQRSLSFADITPDFWAVTAIDQVVNAGYMSGFPDDTFQPDQLVPRYQVLVTLSTGLGLAAPGDVDGLLNQFNGGNDLPNWSKAKVAAAIDQNVVVNYPEPQALAPQRPATRAEIIVMIHQALLAQGEGEPIESPYVNPIYE